MLLRKIISFYFICILLISSTILPLGDFSLMNDLPGMYHSYKKLASPEEAGIIDFIGDYLFAGKTLLGHNKNDKPENPSNPVQFQHAPTGLNFLYSQFNAPYFLVKDLKVCYAPLKYPKNVIEFHPELFRPPLA